LIKPVTKLDIPGPLITSFRNSKQLIPLHFDHFNMLIINCDFLNYLHNSVIQSARNSLVKPLGISIFGDGHMLGLHLMLYGSMHWYEGKNENRFTIAELLFSDGTGLAVTDWQKSVMLSLDPEIAKVPDALDLKEGYLENALKKISRPIKTVLTDGKMVQGIGNAYVDEILYAAKLSPFSVAGKIPDQKIKILAEAIKQVLRDAEAHILKNFPDTITEKERDFLKVHRPKHKLTLNGEAILVTEIASRKTYYTEGQELFD
jgi:formamidopyrimidine-DNA glycosylase